MKYKIYSIKHQCLYKRGNACQVEMEVLELLEYYFETRAYSHCDFCRSYIVFKSNIERLTHNISVFSKRSCHKTTAIILELH